MAKTQETKAHIQENKIVETAEKMLSEEGYDSTSLNDIIHQSGIAKGTFYHYFPSKESLLDKIVSRMVNKILSPIKKIADDPELNAIDKFNLVVKRSVDHKIANKRIYQAITRWIWKEENVKIRHKLMQRNFKIIAPEFKKIIAQGVKEGSFRVRSPESSAQMVLYLSMCLGESMAPLILAGKTDPDTMKIFNDQFKDYEDSLERILGVKSGSLHIYNANVVKEMFSK